MRTTYTRPHPGPLNIQELVNEHHRAIPLRDQIRTPTGMTHAPGGRKKLPGADAGPSLARIRKEQTNG